MEFFKAVGDAVSSFFDAYGTGFGMLILAGFIIAFVVELGIKKAFTYLEDKLAGKDNLLSVLGIAKMAVIFVFTIVASAVSTHLILKGGIVLPGNNALAPFWFAVIYGAQYVFSMYGIKALLRIREKEKEPKAPKEPKPKKAKPTDGMTKIAHNVYKAADGNLYNRKGERL